MMDTGRLRLSVSAETPRQLDVEGVEVDVADALEELGSAGVGQGLGQLVAPGLVFGLEGSELVDGVGPPLRPRPAVLRPLERSGLARRRRGARASGAGARRWSCPWVDLPADEPQNPEGQRRVVCGRGRNPTFRRLCPERGAPGQRSPEANTYHDFASGVRDDRPGLDSCLRALRKGDVLVVWKLDRAGPQPRPSGVNTVHCPPAAWACGCSPARGAQIAERELIPQTHRGRAQGRTGPADAKGGRKFAGRDGPPRHGGVRTVPRTRHQAGDALPVRRTGGPVA